MIVSDEKMVAAEDNVSRKERENRTRTPAVERVARDRCNAGSETHSNVVRSSKREMGSGNAQFGISLSRRASLTQVPWADTSANTEKG